MQDTIGIGASYQNISVIYSRMYSYDYALIYAFKVLKVSKSIGDKYKTASILDNIGTYYHDKASLNYNKDSVLNFYNMSMDYYFKSEKVFLEIEAYDELGTLYGNVGNIYSYMIEDSLINYPEINYNKALKYYDKSIEICKKIDDIEGIAYCNRSIARMYIYKSQFNKAFFYINQALKITANSEYTKNIYDNYKILLLYYEKKNDFKNALKYSYLLRGFL